MRPAARRFADIVFMHLVYVEFAHIDIADIRATRSSFLFFRTNHFVHSRLRESGLNKLLTIPLKFVNRDFIPFQS